MQKNKEFSLNFAKSGLTVLLNYLEEYGFDEKSNSLYSLGLMEKIVISMVVRIIAGYVRIWSQPSALASHLYY